MTRSIKVESKGQYARLLVRMLPHVIHTEEENEQCTTALERLLSKRDRTRDENRMIELLILLIEDFEEKNYALPAAAPLDVLRHLMESNGLRQVDLLDVFGAESTISEVLRGKRDLAKSHIEKLSLRFNVSPELFFEQRSGSRLQKRPVGCSRPRRHAHQIAGELRTGRKP
jgi:HTH-type transcriptional regulator/antitoxin HigA